MTPWEQRFVNDGQLDTYWDDMDHGELYVMRLDWGAPVEFNCIHLSGFVQQGLG